MVAKPIAAARSTKILAEPRIRSGVVAFFRLISPLYIHILLGFRTVDLRHGERLVEAFRDFFDGKSRFLIAFRHPFGDEAQLMAYAIGKSVEQISRKNGERLQCHPHAHFVHGYEVPLWAGPFERWLLPRVGAVPVYHTKFDGKSIEQIRALMMNGDFPLALAPEGQVSYSSETLPRLESGASRICAWCVEDLARAKRPETVYIVPISIHHRWDKDAEKKLDLLLSIMERKCGVSPPRAASRFNRLSTIADTILATAERHYARFYGSALARPGRARAERLADLREAALSTAEHAFHIRPEGDEIRRVYKIRQTGWDRIYRDDLPSRKSKSGLATSLADRISGEAWYASRHMEFVDIAYYLDFDRLRSDDPLELYIETAQNYYDAISRLEGGNISNRIGIRGKHATLVVGEPIPVTERLAGLKHSKKTAIQSLDDELAHVYLECIDEIQSERKERQNG